MLRTWVPVSGMTLPSGHYLQHRPQYFPPSPAFPLSRELATMEANNAAAGPPLPAPAPPPVPVVRFGPQEETLPTWWYWTP